MTVELKSNSFRNEYLRRIREADRWYVEAKPWTNAFFEQFLELRTGIKAVDVGCGGGEFTRYLASLVGGPCSLVGVDIEEENVKFATVEARKAKLLDRVSYKNGDVYALPMNSNIADLTYCRFLLGYLRDPVRAVREMARITKPGGLVVAVEPSGMSFFYDPDDAEFNDLAGEYLKACIPGLGKMTGKDYGVGEQLPRIFQKAGFRELKIEARAHAWLFCDSRKTLKDLEDDLRFEHQYFQQRVKDTSKVLIAGGMKRSRVDEYFNALSERLQGFLSHPEKIRNNASTHVTLSYAIAGRKLPEKKGSPINKKDD